MKKPQDELTRLAKELANEIVLFDRDNPGDPRASISMTAEIFAHWLGLAEAIERASRLPPER